ncbi:uncharacterized protein LOC121644054 isoform X2 [Melanotaenia boesemani]|uniref:uncharacterized protein LOC121644054 isoform X1 n=1 Tax=Melanotaenia boesemani TaxID=1250792 RepID=UPI001C04116E|nr:uncharacterized protein LOC121644054 isoform X1 [Melanotaenia boesemani]XP_041847686.1 uncharacterized protein LOC121644054 isoform X2 [Melanotaenia boesemani]
MSMPVQTNNTTFQDGTCPELVKLGVDTFQCPMCQKVGPYHALVPHLQGHQISVVKYGGYSVYKCHRHCVRSSHYHCSHCPKIIIRKELFISHLRTCLTAGTLAAVTAAPSPTPAGSAVRPAEPLHPSPTRAGSAVRPAEPLHPSPTPAGSAVTLAPTASPPLITVATKGMRTSPQKMTGPKILMSRRRNTTCCFCNLILLKKNLKAHIQRQHTPQHTDPEIDHMYCKRPYSFPSREQVQDNNDSSDQRQDVFTTTRDAGILSEDMSFNRLVERAQQAEQKLILASELLLTFITQDECLRQHLQAVIAGKLTPSWASKGRVRIFLEKEDQLDRVMSFLASLLEAQGTKCHDQVAFVMDVLLPEATLHAIAGVHAVSLHRATEIYECGLQYDYSEKQLFAHYASKNTSKEAEQKMLTYKEQLQRALESKDFVQML